MAWTSLLLPRSARGSKGARTGDAATAVGAAALRAKSLLFFRPFFFARLTTPAGSGPVDGRGPAASCCAAVRAVLGAESAAFGAAASDAGCCWSVCNSCLQSVQTARDRMSKVNAAGSRRLSPTMLTPRRGSLPSVCALIVAGGDTVWAHQVAQAARLARLTCSQVQLKHSCHVLFVIYCLGQAQAQAQAHSLAIPNPAARAQWERRALASSSCALHIASTLQC